MLTEENLSDAVREVRLALLDADVNYGVAKAFVKRVKERAIGEALIKSVKPGEQFIKLVYDELVELMGGGEAPLQLSDSPSVVMLCGLQGSGKTTQAAKLARFLQKKPYNKRPLLVACDLQRPAAILQLQKLGEKAGIAVFAEEGEKDPVRVAKAALGFAKSEGFNTLILDTAGRLHIDEPMMEELSRLKNVCAPSEILFVANAATGQDAVKAAAEFNSRLSVTGTVLTMLDGDARAGAAISIREVTKKPLKFEGVGEKLEDLQLFDARSMADRILGMGDAINLVKKAEEHISEEESEKLEEKIRKATFTYEDYLKQMQVVRKMGSIKGLLKMLPGASRLPNLDTSEKEFRKIESIILSMTPNERRGKDELTISRCKRIARGSGNDLSEVNRLKKSFLRAKQLCKQMSNKKMLEKLSRFN